MRSSYIRRCNTCKAVIFRGWTYTDDEYNEIYGGYDEGAGKCKVCGKEFCHGCGEIKDGVCKACGKEMGKEDE